MAECAAKDAAEWNGGCAPLGAVPVLGAAPPEVNQIFCSMPRGDLAHVFFQTQNGTPGVKPNKFAAYFVYSPQLEQSVCAACFRPPDAHQEAVPAVPAPGPAGQCPYTNEQLVALLPGCSYGGNKAKFAHHFTRAEHLAAGGHLGPVVCSRCSQPIGAHRSGGPVASVPYPEQQRGQAHAAAHQQVQPKRGGAIEVRSYNQVHNIADPEDSNPLPEGLKIGDTADTASVSSLGTIFIPFAVIMLIVSISLWIAFSVTGLFATAPPAYAGPSVTMLLAIVFGLLAEMSTVTVHKDLAVQRELWVVEHKTRRAATLCMTWSYTCTTIGKIMRVTVDQTAWRVNKRAWYEITAHTSDGKSFALGSGHLFEATAQAKKWQRYIGLPTE